MKLYVGIDLHSTNSVVVVQDDEDRVVMQKRLPNDLRTITAWLEPYRDAIAGVAVESTYNWYWTKPPIVASKPLPGTPRS